MDIDRLKDQLNKGRIIIMDGGTGSEITTRGVKTSLPLWSAQALLTHPKVVKQIHKDYIKAGAQIIITNTFRTTKRTFKKADLENKAQEVTILACKLAKEAAFGSGRKVWVAGSIAPLEDCYSPHLVPSLRDLKKEHLENAKNLKKGKVDFILLETMIKIDEVVSACEAARKIKLPLAVSFCCNDRAQLLSGESLEDAVEVVEKFNPIFVSVNCMPPETISKVIKKLRRITKLPIGAYGQGVGVVDGDQGWVSKGENSTRSYSQYAKEWVENGAQVIGGCCGTNPLYIKKLSSLVPRG